MSICILCVNIFKISVIYANQSFGHCLFFISEKVVSYSEQYTPVNIATY